MQKFLPDFAPGCKGKKSCASIYNTTKVTGAARAITLQRSVGEVTSPETNLACSAPKPMAIAILIIAPMARNIRKKTDWKTIRLADDMKEIIAILMKRDGLSFQDAKQQVLEVRKMILEAIENGDYSEPDEIMQYELGL